MIEAGVFLPILDILKTMKSKIFAILIALCVLAWIGSGLINAGENDVPAPASIHVKTNGKKAELPQVRVREMTPENFVDNIAVTGRTQASRSVVIRAETAGQVLEITRQEGEPAAEGETLAKLDLRDRRALVREAEGRVAQRRIEYNAAKQLADKGFNSKVRLAQTEADLEDAKAALKTAQIDLARINITAPFSGMIFEQNVEVGDFLSVGDALFTLVDLDPIELVGFVSERRIQDLELGLKAQAVFLDGMSVEGKISYIAPAADPQTRTFRVHISVPNTTGQIKDGMTAKIAIPGVSRPALKISPAILALNDAGEVGIKIVDDVDIVRFIPVQILADKTDAMWVSGPATKSRVITVGQDYVRDGQKVKPVLRNGEGLL